MLETFSSVCDVCDKSEFQWLQWGVNMSPPEL